MNTERDKFLTEAMGECWHEGWQPDEDATLYYCSNCSTYYSQQAIDEQRSLFSTWAGFGRLWTFAHQQEWWADFVNRLIDKELTKAFPACFIHPDRFADAVYEFLSKDVS